MTTIVIIAAAVYVAGAVATGRWLYTVMRPTREPAACKTPRACAEYGEHYDYCYFRPARVDAFEAGELAVFGGFIWPVAAPAAWIATLAGRL